MQAILETENIKDTHDLLIVTVNNLVINVMIIQIHWATM